MLQAPPAGLHYSAAAVRIKHLHTCTTAAPLYIKKHINHTPPGTNEDITNPNLRIDVHNQQQIKFCSMMKGRSLDLNLLLNSQLEPCKPVKAKHTHKHAATSLHTFHECGAETGANRLLETVFLSETK